MSVDFFALGVAPVRSIREKEEATSGLTQGDSAMGALPIPAELKLQLRRSFDGRFILAGGFDRASAERALSEGQADLIAFARSFLANPDLVQRMRVNAPLNAPDMATFYTPGPKGYTDYPTLAS